MFNIFGKKSSGNLPDKLEEALNACKAANEQAYDEARALLSELEQSIADASRVILRRIDAMDKSDSMLTMLVQDIRNLLEKVGNEFEQSYFKTQDSLKHKRRQFERFNITLFGKTKAGKSTLMEILTHGDGSHMGRGGQRTTKDVHSYDWKGMSVTDVPGIEAYGGAEDAKKAKEAAARADLILFLITAGQPEGNEADWLVELKKMDKPLLCLCNYKQSLGEGVDDFRLKRFLSDPKNAERMNIDGLQAQFQTFVNEQLPNEHIDFMVCHLLAKFYSQQPEYASQKRELEKISRFDTVEQALIQEVSTNGVLHRKRSYLALVDAPLYEQMNRLFKHSADVYKQLRMLQDKTSLFNIWCDAFNKNELEHILNTITAEYNALRNSVPEFVEAYVEDKTINDKWQTHCEGFQIKETIVRAVNRTIEKLEKEVQNLFSELQSEIYFSFNPTNESQFGDYSFFDWKNALGWTSAGLGALAGVAPLIGVALGPLGIGVALGATALLSGFSVFSDSREKKLADAREKLSTDINAEIDKVENTAKQLVADWFNDNIVQLEAKIVKEVESVGQAMEMLSNEERKLALVYTKQHKAITKRIIANIFQLLGYPSKELMHILCAARIPGRLVLVTHANDQLALNTKEISSKLGRNEEIEILKLNTEESFENQLISLYKCFGLEAVPQITEENTDSRVIVYPAVKASKQQDLDALDLIQQIMDVQIILK